uniref:type I protein arginine methyltransferase n=3 Tax=Cacopsylla melanoneura TaxID=428564 RepID=A0A8D8Y6V7_9HEMI
MSAEELKQCVSSRLDNMDVNETNNSDNEDDEGDDWDEIDEDIKMNETTVCLFQSINCTETFSSLEKAILHLKYSHSLDLLELKLVHKMDCYLFIKLINYIRKHNPNPADVLKSISSCNGDITKLPWAADEFMKPHLVDDPWLMYDYDDIEELVDDCPPLNGVHHVNVEHGRITMSQEHYTSLQDQIKLLTQQLQEKSAEIDMKNEDIDQMREVMRGMLNKMDEEGETKSRRHDKYYFNSYEDAHIHAEMIKDTVRTESYKTAILSNRAVFQDKHVIDVGAGTGILSIFAAQAGASRVYAVEKSDIAYETIDIVRTNKYDTQIEVFHKLLEEIELPVDKVDVIVSEWMGYFLLFETMIDSVIDARDKFLRPGGVVCPNRFTMSLAGAFAEDLYKDLVTFWSDVHGLDMSVMTRLVYCDVQVTTLPPASLVTSPSLLTSIDLTTASKSCVEFSSPFSLEAAQDTRLNCLVAWFDTYFDLPEPVMFSTGPEATPTHWKQSVFLLKKPLLLAKGEKLEGTLTCERLGNDSRSLNITISFRDTTQVYQLQC